MGQAGLRFGAKAHACSENSLRTFRHIVLGQDDIASVQIEW